MHIPSHLGQIKIDNEAQEANLSMAKCEPDKQDG